MGGRIDCGLYFAGSPRSVRCRSMGNLKINPKVCLILPDFGISLIDYVQCGCYASVRFSTILGDYD